MKYLFFIFILVSTSFISGCFFPAVEFTDDRLRVINNSDGRIFYHWSFSEKLDQWDRFEYFMTDGKDTIYPSGILPDSSKILNIMGNWEAEINKQNTNKIFIFFFNESQLKDKTWDQIMEDQDYLERQEFNADDIKNGRWTLVYPYRCNSPRSK